MYSGDLGPSGHHRGGRRRAQRRVGLTEDRQRQLGCLRGRRCSSKKNTPAEAGPLLVRCDFDSPVVPGGLLPSNFLSIMSLGRVKTVFSTLMLAFALDSMNLIS